ncbi:TetR/AcrR family transcriptional regulator [Mycolicibacterium sp. P9-64]|uniref:TetR/AcrR family transcriptional regulator n=1 Tax=Mycolicibacterium sp. P9-64 TaxID=2024612 RepID=UPI0011EEA28F|nr:TetR/AcrR family transcriptional regulator [Mycolicibacterium sp. P9-64]KAA0085589.1 TetR/AcrR family transcriptional regulator [Mycolicibacterium sp. P9-64]
MATGEGNISRRRQKVPSKGDIRERAVLDAAERQLGVVGLNGMTVETIATAAGITRGALYFYFSSRNDVLAALVDRTAALVVAEVENASASAPADAREAVREAMTHSASLWDKHGAVMRAAVELSFSVPVIDARWQAAMAATSAATQRLLMQAGVPDDGTPVGAAAISAALVSMSERSFYVASKRSACLEDTARTLTRVWLANMGAWSANGSP